MDAGAERALQEKWDQIGGRLGVERNGIGAYTIGSGELRLHLVKVAGTVTIVTTTINHVVNGPMLSIPGLRDIDLDWQSHMVRLIFELVSGFRCILEVIGNGVYYLRGPNPNPTPYLEGDDGKGGG